VRKSLSSESKKSLSSESKKSLSSKSFNSESKTKSVDSEPPRLRTPHSALRTEGFTLLEVLVASAILSVVLAALYGVFSRTLESKRLVEERGARARTARIVLLRISEDIRASFPLSTTDARFVGETRNHGSFPQSSLAFISTSQVPLTHTGAEGDLSEIRYTLIPDPTAPTQRQLVRRVSSALAAEGPGTEEDLPLLSHVHGLQLRFFDGRTWHAEWGQSNTRTQLPLAVEVRLLLAGPAEEVLEFSTLVDLPLAGARHGSLS
jgi:general secretion pathway protein J